MQLRQVVQEEKILGSEVPTVKIALYMMKCLQVKDLQCFLRLKLGKRNPITMLDRIVILWFSLLQLHLQVDHVYITAITTGNHLTEYVIAIVQVNSCRPYIKLQRYYINYALCSINQPIHAYDIISFVAISYCVQFWLDY